MCVWEKYNEFNVAGPWGRMAGREAKNAGGYKFRKDLLVHINQNDFILWAVRETSDVFKQRRDMSRFRF